MSYPIVNFLAPGARVSVVTTKHDTAPDFSVQGTVIQADGLGLYLRTAYPVVLKYTEEAGEEAVEVFLPWTNVVEVSK